MVAANMLKIVRDQCDRLQETSPQIPDTVIDAFKAKFGETTPGVKKPEITNGLDPIHVYSLESATPAFELPKTAVSIKISSDDHTQDS
jgi:hypothetical protein